MAFTVNYFFLIVSGTHLVTSLSILSWPEIPRTMPLQTLKRLYHLKSYSRRRIVEYSHLFFIVLTLQEQHQFASCRSLAFPSATKIPNDDNSVHPVLQCHLLCFHLRCSFHQQKFFFFESLSFSHQSSGPSLYGHPMHEFITIELTTV